MTSRLQAWLLALPATLLVAVFLGLPVLATFATTFGGDSPLAATMPTTSSRASA
jgi:putative spermidine/putrescine transport system permease protein